MNGRCVIVSHSLEDGGDCVCPSPGAESYLSTGSSMMTSADLSDQCRFRTPCRLQLVKPLEGCFHCFVCFCDFCVFLNLPSSYRLIAKQCTTGHRYLILMMACVFSFMILMIIITYLLCRKCL